MTKEQFIQTILRQTPRTIDFCGQDMAVNFKVIFTNLTTKNREWYKLETFHDADDNGYLNGLKKTSVEFTQSIYDITESVSRIIPND